MQLGIQILDDRATIPYYAHPGDAGMDVFPLEPFVINWNSKKLVKLGFALDIPRGYEVQIRPRSGLALHYGVTVLNSPATIDSGYMGEIGVILINHGYSWYANDGKSAIAQMVIAPVVRAEIVQIDNINKNTSRGIDGYGSTDFATKLDATKLDADVEPEAV